MSEQKFPQPEQCPVCGTAYDCFRRTNAYRGTCYVCDNPVRQSWLADARNEGRYKIPVEMFPPISVDLGKLEESK